MPGPELEDVGRDDGHAHDLAPEAAPRSRSPRWMRVSLVLSLALNLLVFGAVAGWVFGPRAEDRAVLPRDIASAFYLRALPSGDRAQLAAAIRAETPQREARRAAFRTELAETLALLRAEPFDAEAFAARLAAQRSRLADHTRLADGFFVERLAAASPAERKVYADRLEQIARRVTGGAAD